MHQRTIFLNRGQNGFYFHRKIVAQMSPKVFLEMFHSSEVIIEGVLGIQPIGLKRTWIILRD